MSVIDVLSLDNFGLSFGQYWGLGTAVRCGEGTS